MPNDHMEASSGPCPSGHQVVDTTPEFNRALEESGQLLDYAASNGLLSEGQSAPIRSLIQALVLANKMAPPQVMTLQMVTDFWIAYNRLAQLVQPVTAASIAASDGASLTGMRIRATLAVVFVIVVSIVVFMGTTTLNETQDLIHEQNTAALSLWEDVQTLPTTRESKANDVDDRATALSNGRVFAAIVEFSRRSSELLQSADRLGDFVPNAGLPPEIPGKHDEPATGTASGTYHVTTVSYLNVKPDLLTTAVSIQDEAIRQIKSYQEIRNYALPMTKSGGLIYYSLPTYILPTVYALLGAFLYGFRLTSDLIRRKLYTASPEQGSRYFIAAIGGLVVGLFSSVLLNKGTTLPPTAFAFLVGYGVDAFFARLDALIAKLRG